MTQELNKNKVIVGIGAIIASIIAVVLWILKLKYKKQIGVGLLVLITAIAILFWVWYANLASFKDTDKSFSDINQTFDSVTKGDLK